MIETQVHQRFHCPVLQLQRRTVSANLMTYLLRVGAYFWLSQANGALTPPRASTRPRMLEHVSATPRGLEVGAAAAAAREPGRTIRGLLLHRHYRVRSARRRFHKRSMEVPYGNVYSRACLREPGSSKCGGQRNQYAIRATGTSPGARAIGQLGRNETNIPCDGYMFAKFSQVLCHSTGPLSRHILSHPSVASDIAPGVSQRV